MPIMSIADPFWIENQLWFLKSALDAIQDGIIVIDSEGTVVYVNPGFSQILNVKGEHHIGRKLKDICPIAIALQVLKTEKPVFDFAYKTWGNTHIVVTSTPVYYLGKFSGVISIFKKITEIEMLNQPLDHMVRAAEYLKKEPRAKENLPNSFEEICGNNEKFINTLKLAAKVAQTQSTILIRGESGTGKGILTQAIHRASKRNNAPLITVNCAAIPENLLESELFGYADGAYTGSKKGGKPGMFELAHMGTIFLDEIGDMSLTAQAKLLRVIENKQIQRVGGTTPINIDVRVIAATHQDLEKKCTNNFFRADLFYRLNVFSITMPPLRERKEDIQVLSNEILNKLCIKNGQKKLKISPQVMKIFCNFDWPGNIRELQNIIEYASIVCESNTIHVVDLPDEFYKQLQQNDGKELPVDNEMNFIELVSRTEKEALRKALRFTNSNKSEAIKLLGISRGTFYKKIKEYNLEVSNNKKY